MNKKEIENNCGVYVITNLINNKKYVGQSINLKRRWREHKIRCNTMKKTQPIDKIMNSYGIDNFKFEILEICQRDNLWEREIYWIKQLNTIEPYGYNKNYGGNGNYHDYELIFIDWKNGLFCKEIEKKHNCNDMVIHKALIQYGVTQEEIDKRRVSNQLKPLIAFDIETKKPLKIFESSFEAKKFFQAQNNYSFIRAAKMPFKSTCFGFYWGYVNKDNIPSDIFSDEEFLNFQKIDSRYVKIRESLKKTTLNKKEKKLSKEELKKLIRTKSFLEIGRMFNITDNAIRKWCDFYNLPRTKKEIKNISDEEWDKL